MSTPRRPGNDLPRRRPFLDLFEKGFPLAIFALAAAGYVGMIVGLIVGTVGK